MNNLSVEVGKTSAEPADADRIEQRSLRQVAAATIVGTTVEWYDFFLYASAAALVFNKQFFAEAGPSVATLLAFASVGVSFLFRPLGAAIAGHFGDILGRRTVLVITLITMGCATTLIGLLPTFSQIGIAAPLLLILLRIVQGVATGGEWGGAALMAVEHAPHNRRGLMGAFPQLGVPLGILLASGVLTLFSSALSEEAFQTWGWRVPFLLSFVLVGVGYWVRRSVDESPVFIEIAERRERTKLPFVQLFRRHWPLVLLAAFTFAGNSAAGYMTTGGFIQGHATGVVGMPRTEVLLAVTASSAAWACTTLLAGVVSDRIGRRTTYIIGWIAFLAATFPLFALVDTGNVWLLFLGLVLFSIGNGLTYGQLSANFAELFPASIRFSGVSVTYAIGAILGGAFAPLIAQALVQKTGSTTSVAVYISCMLVLGLVSTLLLRDRTGIDLRPSNEAEQAKSPIYGMRSGTSAVPSGD